MITRVTGKKWTIDSWKSELCSRNTDQKRLHIASGSREDGSGCVWPCTFNIWRAFRSTFCDRICSETPLQWRDYCCDGWCTFRDIALWNQRTPLEIWCLTLTVHKGLKALSLSKRKKDKSFSHATDEGAHQPNPIRQFYKKKKCRWCLPCAVTSWNSRLISVRQPLLRDRQFNDVLRPTLSQRVVWYTEKKRKDKNTFKRCSSDSWIKRLGNFDILVNLGNNHSSHEVGKPRNLRELPAADLASSQ